MAYTYKNGYREGVVFAFFKNDMILIENRPVGNNQYEIFFTSGSIEDKDYIHNSDYKVVAMLREVSEEFEDRLNIINYIYLDEIKVNEINVVFYIYLITEWEGSVPEFTIEEGEKFSKVEWIKLSEKNNYFEFESAFEICSRIEEFLYKNQTKY